MTRQAWLFVALGALAISSLLASIGAWILLWRDRRNQKVTTRTRPGGAA